MPRLQHGQETHHEPVIDTLRIQMARIMKREQVGHERLELLFKRLGVAPEQRARQPVDAAAVTPHAGLHPARERA